MTPITVSINPTYLCNFRCDFCYLTEEQLADKNRISIADLNMRLAEIANQRTIEHIDLYGGEVALLPSDYARVMINVIRHYYEGPINVITNLSRVPVWFLESDKDIQLSVSWDYNARQDYMKVYSHMVGLHKDMHVLMLASHKMVNWSDEDIIMANTMLNQLSHVVSVEIKPYSTNQANADPVSFADFERFVQRWSVITDRSYEFVNTNLMRDAISGKRNAWSDDHVYITPNGKLGVLEFDTDDNEFFTELDYFDQYVDWADGEKNKIGQNKYCSECRYFGHCLSEHLRDVKSLDESCNGFVNLLDWYAKRS